ncbi:MAG: AcrR family transcriptional regulator [Paraglaciecola sp.]|jgi:AcrR family transcriptional regulator
MTSTTDNNLENSRNQSDDTKHTLGHLKGELLSLKRNRILEEATILFFDQGYAGTTIDAIAKRLQVTKPFIYSYFKNKEAILAAVCETGVNESLEVLQKALSTDGSYRDIFIQTLWQVGNVVIKRQACIVTYLREIKKLNPQDGQRILLKRHEFDHNIAKLINCGASAGEFELSAHEMDVIWIGGLITWLPVWFSLNGKLSQHDVLLSFVSAGLKLIGAEKMSELEKNKITKQ